MALSMAILPLALGRRRTRDGERTIGEEEDLYDQQDIKDEEEARQRRIEKRLGQTRFASRSRGRNSPSPEREHEIESVEPAQGGEGSSSSGDDFVHVPQLDKTQSGNLETEEDLDEKSETRQTESNKEGKLPRTITIAEEHTTYDKTLPYAQAFPKRKKFSRSATMSSISSFADAIREDWEERHDRDRQGFWKRTFDFAVGGKEAAEAPRMGDEDYVAPKYRWTPILSGLIIPFSILLEIPGLTEHWYVRDIKATGSNDYTVEYQENPRILDIGLGVSIGCALVANVALISRFLERRVYGSTIVAICALTIHDIINIIAVTVFGVIHRFDDGFTYAEAFWLTVCSSVASLITNITLIFDMIKTEDFKHSGSGLTTKQRKLVIAVMVLLAYIALGALVYNLLVPEFTFQSALYFTIVSIETIGFGDLSPTTTSARIFFFFYETLGVLNLAVAVGTARDTLLESWEAAYKRRRLELQRRHRERKKQRTAERARHRALERKLISLGFPVYAGASIGGGGRGGAGKTNQHALNLEVLTAEQIEAAELEAAQEVEEEAVVKNPDWSKMTASERRQKALEDIKALNEEMSTQSISSEEGYREFTEKIAREERFSGLIKFGFAFTLFLTFWIIGATIFSQTEEWTWFVAFYFCYVSFTTVGFGDFFPITPAGRAFFVVWALFGVATMTLLLAVIAEAYETTYKNSVQQKGLKRALAAVRHNNSVAMTRHRTNTLLERSSTIALDPGSLGVTGLFSLTMGGQNPEMKLESEEDKLDPNWDNVKTTEVATSNLPYLVLQAVKSFNDHVQYFVHHHSADPPPALKALLEAMTEEQAMSPQEKEEVMGDADARRVLFMMSYERTMLALVQIAERAILDDNPDKAAPTSQAAIHDSPTNLPSSASMVTEPDTMAPLLHPSGDEDELEITPAPRIKVWDPESNEEVPGWKTE